MNKTILVTGAAGMLGSHVVQALVSDTAYRVIATGRSALDIAGAEYIQGDLTDPSFVEYLCSYAPYDTVVHCAAEVNLKRAEDEPEVSRKIHIEATRQLAELLQQAVFIYISTDSVFDGITGGYLETDPVHPLNQYAATKLEGERMVQKYSPFHYIMRTNIYGFQFPQKNSLVEWAYKELKAGKTIQGFSNVHFNPLYTRQLAAIILLFIRQQPSFGIYHVTSDESVSKYDFLKKVAEQLGLDTGSISASEADYTNVALKRPNNTFLNNTKLKLALPAADTDLESGMGWLHTDLQTNNLS